MANKICPNCGANLEKMAGDFKYICNYCDSTFDFSDEELERIFEGDDLPVNLSEKESDETPASRLFDIRIDDINEKALKCWKELCAWINDRDTIDSYLETIDELAKKNSDIATNNVNVNILRTAETSIQSQFTSGEETLFFVNNGIISKGKDYFLVTNKSIFRVSKKKIYKIDFRDIHSIIIRMFSGTFWMRINNDDKFDFCQYLSPEKTGMMLALVCTLAKECHSDNYKIIIDGEN